MSAGFRQAQKKQSVMCDITLDLKIRRVMYITCIDKNSDRHISTIVCCFDFFKNSQCYDCASFRQMPFLADLYCYTVTSPFITG